MRTTIIVLIISIGIAAPSAAQDAPGTLGSFQISADLSTMWMQHRTFDTDDGGLFAGLGVYGHLGDDWYIGGEIGTGSSLALLVFDDSSFVPVEVNAKRAFRLKNHIAADLGAGLCFGRVEYSRSPLFWGETDEVDQWVPGGQVFADLLFDAGGFFLGLKTKYQLTADADEVADLVSSDEGWDYSNFRFGIQFGFMISH